MKKFLALALAIVMILSFAACGRNPASDDAGSEPATPSSEGGTKNPLSQFEGLAPMPTKSSINGLLTGTFKEESLELDENEEHYINVYNIDGLLLVEHGMFYDGSFYSGWTEEIWPNDAEFIFDDSAMSLGGYSLSFASYISDDEYMGVSTPLSISTDGESLEFNYIEDGVKSKFIPADPVEMGMSTADCLNMLHNSYNATSDPIRYSGTYCFSDNLRTMWMRFGDDNSFLSVMKVPEMPVRVLKGAYMVDEYYNVRILGTKLAYGEPVESSLSIISFDDKLLISDAEYYNETTPILISEGYDDYVFTPVKDSWIYTGVELLPVGSEESFSGSYEDTYGNTWYYNFSLPFINEETPGATTINKAIKEKYGPILSTANSLIESMEPLGYSATTYDAYKYENVLSLIVYNISIWGDACDYSIYYYDMESGKELSAKDILEKRNMTESDLLMRTENAASYYFYNFFIGQFETIDEADALWEQNATKEYFNMERVKPYIGSDGSIRAFAPILSYMQNGCYEICLDVDEPLYGMGVGEEEEEGEAFTDLKATFLEDEPATPDKQFVAEDGEYATTVVLTAGSDVKDIKFLSLSDMLWNEELALPEYTVSESLDIGNLTAGEKVAVKTVFYGDIPNNGISYVNEDGETVLYALGMSGMDGSLYLTDIIEKKGDDSVKETGVSAIPTSLEEFKSMPEAAMATPFDTATMTIFALCAYPQNKAASLEMLDYLRGPRPLSGIDKQFIADRFMDTDYVPRSYFKGATPANEYTPDIPYVLDIKENPYSYQEEGYAVLYLTSGGADNPRSIKLRLAKDGKWYLWEFPGLLMSIRIPESQNPWA